MFMRVMKTLQKKRDPNQGFKYVIGYNTLLLRCECNRLYEITSNGYSGELYVKHYDARKLCATIELTMTLLDRGRFVCRPLF